MIRLFISLFFLLFSIGLWSQSSEEVIVIKKKISDSSEEVEVEVKEGEDGEMIIWINGEESNIGEMPRPVDGEIVHITVIKEEKSYPRLGLWVENSKGQGALVEDVVCCSNAEEKGMKKGDLIYRIDKTPVSSADELIDHLRQRKAGDCVKLRYLRDGKTKKAKIKLVEAPEQSQVMTYSTEREDVVELENVETYHPPVERPAVDIYELNLDYRSTSDELLLEFAAELTPTKVELKSEDGKVLYAEDLPNFNGRYMKMIPIDVDDISGVELIISQKGKHINHTFE